MKSFELITTQYAWIFFLSGTAVCIRQCVHIIFLRYISYILTDIQIWYEFNRNNENHYIKYMWLK